MEPAVDWSPFDDLDPRRPGAVAAVVGGGDVLAWGSFGSAGPGGEALTVESTVYVASVAKQFTAGVVGLLALDGALGLDDPVRRWLPELRPSWDGVRIHHLLAHTGGLADANRLDAAAGFGADRPFSTAERVALIAGHDLEHPPGAVHRYSNHGYVLLAAIVERACGETLGEVARRRIFEPLGMSASGFLDGEAPAAVPGWAGGTERVDVRFRCVGDGGLVTSIADLARWDGWLPTSSLADLMLRDRPRAASGELAHDAWGISIRTHRGLRIESHGGSLDGYLAAHVRFPALGARSWCSPTRTPAGPRGSGGGPGKWSTPASPTTSTPVGRRGPRPTASRSTPDARRPPVGLPAVRTVEVGGIRVSAIGLVCWQF
ncbi:MAG: serine hydrolase domain-containing protein, partial [Acidimicrobiia bacterium]